MFEDLTIQMRLTELSIMLTSHRLLLYKNKNGLEIPLTLIENYDKFGGLGVF